MSKEKEPPGPWRFHLIACSLLAVGICFVTGLALYFFIIPKVVQSSIIQVRFIIAFYITML